MCRKPGFVCLIVLGLAQMCGVAEARRLADISLRSGTITATALSPGDAISGSITGNWWTEVGSEGAVWYAVAGFRDSGGSWVGGDPVAVEGMTRVMLPLHPGRSFSDNSFRGLTAPTSPGAYSLWVQMVPVTNLGGAISAFKTQAATADKQYHKRLRSITVSSLVQANSVTLRDAVVSGSIGVEVLGTGTDACFGPCMVVRAVNRQAGEITVLCERGTVLVARNPKHQNMVVAHETVLEVTAYSERTHLVSSMCLDMKKLPPQSCQYDVAREPLSGPPATVLEVADRRGLYNEPAGQYALWAASGDWRRDEVKEATRADPQVEEQAASQAQQVLNEALGPGASDRFARSVPFPIPPIAGLDREQSMWVIVGVAIFFLIVVLVAARRPRRQLSAATNEKAKESAPTNLPKVKRPSGVTLLGSLYVLGGVLGTLATAAGVAMILGSVPMSSDAAPMLLAIGVPGLIFGGGGAVLSFAIGIGLLRLRNWARVLILVFGAIGILLAGASTLMALQVGAAPIVPAIPGVISLLIVIYLCSHSVKQAFAAAPQ